MQDIRKFINIVAQEQTPQVGDAFDLEFGENTAVISTTIEKIGEDTVTVLADDKALDFISKLEEVCGCEMEEEHEEEHPDHEVNMGRSQMYHTMKNAKAIHDMLQKVSEREGIEGWVASKLTKASDYLKVVKDYLEYEMVQAGFDKNEEPAFAEAKYQGRTVKLNKPQRTGTDEPGKFKVYVKDPKTGNVKMVRFGHQGGGKNKDSKTMRIKKSNAARRKSFRARHNCSNPGPKTKARYWSCRAW
jgi:hypothetical protein